MPAGFPQLLSEVKLRILTSQTRAMLSVDAVGLRLYWDIGQMIDRRQKKEGWGASVIPRLSAELRNELPELKGFSERDIKRMLAFHRAYTAPDEFVPQAVAQLPAAEKGHIPRHNQRIPANTGVIIFL